MLRKVLSDYLNQLKDERELDAPFMALLSEMDFYDIHYVHGNVEFGKDFIAKRLEDDVVVQYAFQLKAGDISYNEWREPIMGQLREAVYVALSHPNFDANAPRQVVIVTNGELVGNVKTSFQGLNQELVRTNNRPIAFWGKSNLLDLLEKEGLSAIQQATVLGFDQLGRFFLVYSRVLDGKLTYRQIELYSTSWLDESLNVNERVFRATIEAEVLATKCAENGFLYEAIHALLGALRVVLNAIYKASGTEQIERLAELYELTLSRLRLACQLYVTEFQQSWQEANRDLVSVLTGSGAIMTYLVHCARIIEIAGCSYFLAQETEHKNEMIAFITDFLDHEEGCGRIPSDRYAVSLIPPVLALIDAGGENTVRTLLEKATTWLCDRYKQGMGLAGFDASETYEVNTLLGYPFDFVQVDTAGGSFAATVLSDLSAFLGDSQFYTSVFNAMRTSVHFLTYWQVQDSEGQFLIEGEDVITYPTVTYSDTFSEFGLYQFADHISNETRSFKVAETVGPIGHMLLMLLLRDRYFPTLWPALVNRGSRADT